jgi:pseudouridylate synthase
LRVDVRANDAADVANIFRVQRSLQIESALLLTVPVPAEFEIRVEDLQTILFSALERAERKGITGPELTPFLLQQMAARSGGATLRTNIALLENNARAAAIASAIG